MRANSSLASLVVVLILASGCRPAEDQVVVVAPPEAPAPDPAPVPGPTQVVVDDSLREVVTVRDSQTTIDVIPERPVQQERTGPSVAAVPSRTVSRLFFQCTGDVAFAVRGVGSRLQVYPPGYSGGYIALTQQPSDSDLYATSRDAEFRMDDDLATLVIGPDRYVDCVSSPAAAVWQEPPIAR